MFETKILDVQGDHYMKFISIVLGLLVIISWLFVLREYQHGHENRKRKVSHYHCLYIDFHYDINQYTRLTKTAPHNEVLLFISSIMTQ